MRRRLPGLATTPLAGIDGVDVESMMTALRAPHRRRGWGLVLLLVLALVGVIASLALGARDIAPSTVLEALLHPALAGTSFDAAVVIEERLPRTLLAVLTGVALGGAGAIMQAVTRNPLVDGGVLGTELGAAGAIVIAILLLDVSGARGYFWLGLIGAAVTTAAVLLIARLTTEASETVSLVISGAAASALLAALITVMILVGYPFGDEGVITRAQLESDRLFTSLSAVRGGHYSVIPAEVASPLTYKTPLSVPWVLAKMTPLLQKAVAGT